MARKKNLQKEAEKKEKNLLKVTPLDMDDAFDALDDDDPFSDLEDITPSEDEDDDEDDDTPEIDERFRGTPQFVALQQELSDIRTARQQLTLDMEAPELDKDERDTLKARGTLLDSRERSAREELKLFHKNELTQLGQIRKVRVVIEMTINPKTGQPFEDKFEGRI